MGRSKLLFLVLAAIASQAIAQGISAHKLKLTYSAERSVCREVERLLRKDKACRHFDAINCSDAEFRSMTIDGKDVVLFEEIGTNEYGYTQVARAISTSNEKHVVIYLNQFQGDRHPRLVQTWRVDGTALSKVLALPPGPLPYEKWINLTPTPPKDTNATEFNEILVHGEKISDEWSPIIEVLGHHYAIERECAGTWAFGGDYACERVIKLTAKRLEADGGVVPICAFAKGRKK